MWKSLIQSLYLNFWKRSDSRPRWKTGRASRNPRSPLHYLVDGYNLLYALPDIPPGPWPKKREIFLKFLEVSKPQGRNRLTVVFDSREGGGTKEMHGTLEVVYTAGESADDWLIKF